jgi:putative ABC transport system substrate-binding protein
VPLPQTALLLRTIADTAPSFAMAVRVAPCRDDADIEAAMMDLAREERGSLLVLPDIFTFVHRDVIVALAFRYRLPAIYLEPRIRRQCRADVLRTDNSDLFRRAAGYVDRILRGDKPGDLPVQQPTKFELVINLKTAKALDITIPTTLIAVADEAIE